MEAMERLQELGFRYRAVIIALLAILVLIIARPTPMSLICSLPLVLLGEGIRVWALGYIGVYSRGERTETKEFVSAGPYAYTRNPLYWGNFLTGLGLTIASVGNFSASIKVIIITTVIVVYLVTYVFLSVPHEERYLEKEFGEEYLRYKGEVPRWLWRLSPYKGRRSQFKFIAVISTEYWTWIWIGLIYLILLWKLKAM